MGASVKGGSLVFGNKTPDVDTPNSNGGNGGPANDNPGGGNKVPENNGSSNPDTRGNGDTPNAANDNADAPNNNARNDTQESSSNPNNVTKNDDANKRDNEEFSEDEFPDGPASSAANAQRLKEQLERADKFEERRIAAPDELSDIRSNIPYLPTGRQGTAAIAHVDIEGLPDTKTLKAHSAVDAPQNGIIGNGGGNFDAQTLPNRSGRPIDRVTDAEFKILDNLADALGSNRFARGTVDIFVDNPVCDSCTSVIKQFQE